LKREIFQKPIRGPSRGLITQVLIRSSSLPATSFPSSSFSFLVMVMCNGLPPRKVLLDGHVELPLSAELQKWSEDHPDDWHRYKAYAHACTRPEELNVLLECLEHWSATRSEGGQLEAVVDQYSNFLIEAEADVKTMPPGTSSADRCERLMKKFGELLASSTLTIADKKPQLKVFDLKMVNNVSNANEVLLPAVPPEQLRVDRVVVLPLLNLPYDSGHAVRHRARGQVHPGHLHP